MFVTGFCVLCVCFAEEKAFGASTTTVPKNKQTWKFQMYILVNSQSCFSRGPGSAVTLPEGQLRPYPCQGSAATLPTRILWKGQRFLTIPGVSCDPTSPQCTESYRFLHYFKLQVQHSFYPQQLFIKIFPPLCSPCFQLQHSFYEKHSFYQNFPPPSAAHAFNYNIPFMKNIPFIEISPLPLCSPCFQWFRLPGVICDPTCLPFIKIFPPLCSPCFQLQHSFLSKTFLLSKFSPPLCSPCFQLQHSFYEKHSFYQNPLCSPCCHLRPYLTSFYQNFPPPSAAHAFNYNIPFMKSIPFIKISPPPLCSPCFQLQHSFYAIKIFPSPLQPMLSTTTFLFMKNIPFIKISPPPLCSPCFQLQHSFYEKTFLLSKPPVQPMLSSATLPVFLLSKFPPPSAAHAFNYNIPFIKKIPFIQICPPPPSAAHAFNYNIPFLKNIPFIKILERSSKRSQGTARNRTTHTKHWPRSSATLPYPTSLSMSNAEQR